jgi:ribosomal protein S18 acetylase RimI-like enzyme
MLLAGHPSANEVRATTRHWEDRRVTTLDTLETYYDLAPRASATVEEVGPFTLFLRADEDGWPYYARPRLGLPVGTTIAPDDVRRVRERQRELGAPETFEWVHETTPSLIAAARTAGLHVEECPLLVLDDPMPPPRDDAAVSARVSVLDAHSDLVPAAIAAVSAGFAGTDEVAVPSEAAVARRRRMVAAGLVALAVAVGTDGTVVGGGSHGPRGDTTELAGIAVLPRARKRGVGEALTRALVDDARHRGLRTVFLSAQDDAVARVYERVGFRRVGTACLGAPEEDA